MSVTKLKVNQLDTDSVGATQLIATAVTPGSYTHASLTVDADGRLTAASSGSVVTLPNFVDGEVPAGTVDGSNVTFTLAQAPNPATSLHLYKNGLRQKLSSGNDYTLSSLTITMLTGNIPASGDQMLADYRY